MNAFLNAFGGGGGGGGGTVTFESLLAGGANMGTNTATGAINLGTITDTTARPLTISQTLNNAGLSGGPFSINLTNTSSASGSFIQRWREGGNTKLFVDTSGNLMPGASGGVNLGAYNQGFGVLRVRQIYIESGAGNTGFSMDQDVGIEMGKDAQMGFGPGAASVGSNDTYFTRGGAGIMDLKNADNAQELSIFGAVTGDKRLRLYHDGTNSNISSSSGYLGLGGGNGIKIGLSNSETIGLYGVAGTAQQSAVATVNNVTSSGSDLVDLSSLNTTLNGYASSINDIIAKIQAIGITA